MAPHLRAILLVPMRSQGLRMGTPRHATSKLARQTACTHGTFSGPQILSRVE